MKERIKIALLTAGVIAIISLCVGFQSMTVSPSGGAVSFPLLAPNGSAPNPSYAFTNTSNTGMYATTGPAQLQFAVGGSNVMTIGATSILSQTNGALTVPAFTGTNGDDGLFFFGGSNSGVVANGGGAGVNLVAVKKALALTNNTVTTVSQLTDANNTTGTINFSYNIDIFDGTNVQYENGMVTCGVNNKAGVFSQNTCLKFGNQQGVTAGTLTVTWTITGANPALVQVNSNSSLVTTRNNVTVTILSVGGGQTVTP